MHNIITVTFRDSNTATANGVRQWDYGQILRIQGLQLPTAVEVHFAIIDSKDSVTRIGTTKDGVTDVVIPDSMIEAGKNIFAYVYLRDSESGQTEYEIKIVVTTRAKPEAFNRPEDKELFAQAIEAVNKAADRAEKAGQDAAEAATQAAEDAQQTAEDRKEVVKMVETVADISEQVKKVEELSNKAQEAATKTEADAQQTAEDRVEVGKMLETVKDASEQVKSVEESVRKAKESEQAAAGHRTAVEEMKNSVEQTASTFPQKVQSGIQAVENAGTVEAQEITQAGTAQKTAVEGAGTQAVQSVENVKASATEAVETVKTEAIQAVQSEGNTQTGSVTEEGTKQVKAVQDKGAEVLQSIPEDFQTQMEAKLDKQQGVENKGKALVIGEDGNVVPGEVQSGGGDGIAIINTMSGESPLVISDSAERTLERLELGGKTEQVTTTGAQLWKPIEDKTVNGVEITTDKDGVIHLNGTCSDSSNVILGSIKTNATYTLSCVSTGIFPSNTNVKISAGVLSILNNKGANVSVTGLVNGDLRIRLEGGFTYNKCTLQIMLNEGSTAKPYEPYTGNKPSPSQEYPQEIKNSGKWNEETQKYEVDVKITGRNLFNGKLLTGKFITDDMNIVSDLVTMNTFDAAVEIKPNTDYVISANGVIWSGNINIYDESGKKIVQYYTGKFRTPSNAKYIRASIANATAPIDSKIQMEYGSAMNEFEQYHQPQTITLTSDRPITKWDKLVEQGGEIGWLYKGKLNEIPKTGYALKNTLENKYGVFFSKNGIFKDGCKTSGSPEKDTNIFTHFKSGNPYSSNGNIAWLYVAGGNSDLRIKVDDETINSVELFEKYIADKDIKILYETAQTEFIPLPQSEQNAIRALKTYYPTTVITVDGGELDPDIKVTYTADTKLYIDNKVSANVASIISQYQLNTANLLSLMPMETQATIIENDTNNILGDMEVQKHE